MYSRLNPSRREIRLIYLYPGTWDDTINCQLRNASLDDQPYFKALSYVWGNAQHKELIAVNSQSFPVTKNLFMGLQRIRDSASILTLWVDALCINQADMDERCQQVQLMGAIYTAADEVSVWLGYGGDSSAPRVKPKVYQWTGNETDMEIVKAYFHEHDQEQEGDYTDNVLGVFVYIKLRASNWHLAKMPFFKRDGVKLQAQTIWPGVVQALETLSSVPWWTRIWVFQEIVLARKATVLYSHVTAPWDMLAQSAKNSQMHDQFCCEEFLEKRSMAEELIITKFRRVMYDEIELLRSLRSRNTRLSLSQAVSQTFRRDATDPRDKIYGLLGIVTNWYHKEPLLPDYHLNLGEILMRASTIELQGSLSLQGLMGTPRADVPGIPSWVTQSSNSEQWRASQESRINRTSLFRASGHTIANVQREGGILIVDGFEPIDNVASVGPTMLKDTNTWQGIIEVVKEWRQMCQLDGESSGTYAEQRCQDEKFWRTIVNDCIGWHHDENNQKKGTEIGVVHSSFRRLEDLGVSDLPNIWWSWLQSQVYDSKGTHNEQTKSDETFKHNSDYVRLFQQSFLGATALRRFFLTTSGRMGLGPLSVLPGDAVVIMLGGDTPFITRRKLDVSRPFTIFVGDVYVHGLMDAEGVPVNYKEQVRQILLA